MTSSAPTPPAAPPSHLPALVKAAPLRSARSLRRRLAYRLLIALLLGVGVEAGLRAAVAIKLGPSVLAYGTPLAKQALQPTKMAERPWHEQIALAEKNQKQVGGGDAGYLKYHPHQKKDGFDQHGVQYQVGINGQGFRGAEFGPKRAGVVRVVALGASSTFGYHDRDDETWPVYLEQQLNARLAQEPQPGINAYEVLNLGIPHLNAANIVALFTAEALPLEPDVVVFYEGVNETRRLEPSGPEQWLHTLSKRLVTGQLVYQVATPWFASFDAEDLAAARVGKVEQFLHQLEQLRGHCRERSIRLIVTAQQAQSETLARERLAEVTYAEEVAQVEARLAQGASLSLRELQFLLHAELMAAQRQWAQSNGVEYADGIAALDRAGERDQLLSWVHLAPEGNRALAQEIAQVVWSGKGG